MVDKLPKDEPGAKNRLRLNTSLSKLGSRHLDVPSPLPLGSGPKSGYDLDTKHGDPRNARNGKRTNLETRHDKTKEPQKLCAFRATIAQNATLAYDCNTHVVPALLHDSSDSICSTLQDVE